MKADVYDKKGVKKGKKDLPEQFSEAYRPNIITRAFNANISNTYQHHGTDPMAGLRKVTELSKRRRKYRGVYGAGRSRTPKKIISRRGTRFNFTSWFVSKYVFWQYYSAYSEKIKAGSRIFFHSLYWLHAVQSGNWSIF